MNLPRRTALATVSILVSPLASQSPIGGARPAGPPAGQQPGQTPAEGERNATQHPEQKPVVVTARKWPDELSDLPESASAFDERQLLDGGIRVVRDASLYVPNTLLTEFSSRRLSFPFVRGVGSGQGDPAVATFYDGVPQLAVSSTNLTFLDVERVEFLRGPSSALYGRNTIGGAINVYTRRPDNELRFDSGVTIGNHALQDYRFVVSTPIVKDELFFSFAGLYASRDGYTTNDFTGHDVDSRREASGRIQFLWTPDAHTEVRLQLAKERARDGGFVLSDLQGLKARPNHISQDFEGKADRDQNIANLTINRTGDRLEFTSISAFQDWDISETSDFDFSAFDAVRRYTDEDQSYFYQEFRLGSPESKGIDLGSAARLRWLVGMSGFYSDASQAAANDFRTAIPPSVPVPLVDRSAGDFDSWSAAVFGQATVTFARRLDVTAALRYQYEEKDADITRTFTSGGVTLGSSSSSDSESFDEIMPRVSIAYHFTDGLMGYGLAARGFKAGGFNLTPPPAPAPAAFGPEKSWTYEIGVRWQTLEKRLSTSLALFHIDWDDMQLSQFDAMTGGYVANAGASTSQGVELEVSAKPIDALEVFGSLGFLDTEFDRFRDSFGQDVSGNNLPFAPENTVGAGVQYVLPVGESGRAFARAEYFRIGDFYYDAGNRERESYELVNFRVGGGGECWRVEGWVANAFDENYIPVAFQPNPADPTAFVGESAADRTYGVSLSVRF